MAPTTHSEALFAALCEDSGIDCERVQESTTANERRPDFTIVLGNDRVVVEIKQFDPNAEEARLLEALRRGEQIVSGGVPGERIRRAIASAGPQLRGMSLGVIPALLVVYDNVGLGRHTDPYAVLTAMRGLDVVPVLIPPSVREAPVFLDSRPGPRKKMTGTSNTSISAVAVLHDGVDGQGHLSVYHNPHAVTRMDMTGLRMSRITHFVMKGDQSGWDVA
jgi:hypothetical protein